MSVVDEVWPLYARCARALTGTTGHAASNASPADSDSGRKTGVLGSAIGGAGYEAEEEWH